ncbi:MAG: SpoIVB peptidase S55 domain-containing protein, partial [Angelakisella sp.]
QAYAVEIETLNNKPSGKGQNMVVKVTDPRLLSKTGGIVQGMSGSPIVQNGMLVGSVTHVFVNDPQRGFGIFAENIAQNAGTVSQSVTPAA